MKLKRFNQLNEGIEDINKYNLHKYGINRDDLEYLIEEFIKHNEKVDEIEEKISNILNPVVDQMIKQKKFEEAKTFLNMIWKKAEKYQISKDTKIAQINTLIKNK